MNVNERVEQKVRELFLAALRDADADIPPEFERDLVLLDSGLDSLGFAVLVARLEEQLGYDPFSLLDEPVYPRTYGEFLDIYLKFSEHCA